MGESPWEVFVSQVSDTVMMMMQRRESRDMKKEGNDG